MMPPVSGSRPSLFAVMATVTGLLTLSILLTMTSLTRRGVDAVSTDYEEDDEIIVLNSTNFDKALSEFKYLFVEFYAPWCGHCKALAPEYTKLAQLLDEANSEAVLAKVDATVEKKIAERYSVSGYPTLKLFRHGRDPVDYTGKHSPGEMFVWLRKKLGSPFEKIDTVEAANDLINKSIVCVIGFFKDIENSKAARAYREAADAIDDVFFAITDNADLLKEYEAEHWDTVILFKKFDEGRAKLFGPDLHDVQNIKDLVENHRLPVVVEFNDVTAPKIFRRSLDTHILLFISKASSKFDDTVADYQKVALKYRGKLLFVYVDVDPAEYKRVLDFFGIKRSSCPTYRIIRLEGNVKYKPDTDEPNKEELTAFIDEVLQNKRKPHYMSEPIPSDWDSKPVKELVGLNFDEVVRDKTKDVLVKFYAPWCNQCKELAPVWDQLGEKYKSNGDVVIAKMDATANEVDGLKISFFPTIRLFTKDGNEEFEFPKTENRTIERLSQFLELRGQLPQEKAPEVEAPQEGKKEEL